MNAVEMRALVNDCCAAFSAAPPPARSCELWAEMCARVPVRAAAFIRAKILERESLPRNFGKAVLDTHREWLATLPAPERRPCCPDCDPALPGFFYAWKRDGAGRPVSVVFRCLCNEDATFADMTRASKEQVQRQGYAVMPRGWKGGPAGFEMREFPPLPATRGFASGMEVRGIPPGPATRRFVSGLAAACAGKTP